MAVRILERSKITSRGQTTVPKSVRKALGVSYGGEIGYVVDESGVSVVRIEDEATDPVIGRFLDFLAGDMIRNPGTSVAAFPPDLAARMVALTTDVEVDLDAPLDGPVAL